MESLNWQTIILILVVCVQPMLSNECPIGFYYLDEIMGGVCVKVNRNETFFEKQSKCTGNIVPLNFYEIVELNKFVDFEEFWVDYVRSYPDGPFINWLIGDPDMGKPAFLLNDDYQNGSKFCCVRNLRTSTFRAVDCEERFPRFCIIPTYKNAAIASWNCSDKYIPFMSPIPACVAAPPVTNSTRKAPLRAKIDQARNFCLKHEGHLLHRGYIYSNHPEFFKYDEVYSELPLGMMRLDDKFFWKEYPEFPNGEEITEAEYNFNIYEDFNSNKKIVSLVDSYWKLQDPQHIFYNVMCEYFFTIPTINLKIIGNSAITTPLLVRFDENQHLNQDDIICFTDSVKHHPTPVSLERFTSCSYKLNCTEDGYYWCMLNNTREFISNTSDKVLYIQNKDLLDNRFAILVCCQFPFDLPDFNTVQIEILSNYYNEEKCINDIFDSLMKRNMSSIRVKRILNKKQILIHVNLSTPENSTISEKIKNLLETPSDDILESSIGYIRSVKGCIGLDTAKDEISEFGDVIIKNQCESYECVGDFDVGGYWKKIVKDIEDCENAKREFETDYCGNRDLTTTSEPNTSSSKTTTTTPIYTTPSPEDQINNMENKLEELLNSTSVTPDQLADATNGLNEILNFGEGVVIPKTILQNLDNVITKVKIPHNESSVKIVESNIAIIVGNRSGSNPVTGIAVDPMDDGFEENNTHVLTNDDSSVNPNSEIYVHIPPTVSTKERLSFTLFKNDNAFSVDNSSQRVNTRVINVMLNDVTQFRAGQYIDIHFKPYEKNVERNESKVCAFWDFNTGPNGNWSTRGCELLPRQKYGMDTCRCNHLTHFAQIIRPDKDFGDLHYKILTIITYVGCFLSLISLIIIGLTGASFKSWRRDFSNKIRLNLSASITLLIVTFLIIDFFDVHKHDGLCIGTGITLHYSILASFCWMFISAVLSYQSLVQVFARNSSHRLIKACLFGWLIPAVPIIIICSIDIEIYSLTEGVGTLKKAFCYPTELALGLTIMLPIAIIVAANMILFCMIIYSVFINSKVQRHGDNNQFYRSLTVSFLLFFLFGLTWIFGLLSDNIVMAYLFCITATVQGFVLCVFFVLGNKKARELWCVKLNLMEKRKLPVTSSMSKSMSRGMSSNGKSVSLKNIDYHYTNTTPKFLSGNFADSDSKFS